jgi:hypothetical protein
MGLRESLLKRAATRTLVEHDAGLDETVFIRPMSGSSSSRLEAKASVEKKSAKDLLDLRWMVLRDCLCNADGEQILSADDRELFNDWSREFYEPLFEKCLEVSGVSTKDKDELGLNEDDEKN